MSDAGEAPHLGFDQFAVNAVPLQERLWRAVLDDLALLQNDDAIEIAHRRQAVGDGNDGAAAHQAAQRLADQLLGFAIQRRGGLVEQQQRRVLQEGARNRDPLPLPAGQAQPAISHDRVQPLRQLPMKPQQCAEAAACHTSSSVASGRA